MIVSCITGLALWLGYQELTVSEIAFGSLVAVIICLVMLLVIAGLEGRIDGIS